MKKRRNATAQKTLDGVDATRVGVQEGRQQTLWAAFARPPDRLTDLYVLLLRGFGPAAAAARSRSPSSPGESEKAAATTHVASCKTGKSEKSRSHLRFLNMPIGEDFSRGENLSVLVTRQKIECWPRMLALRLLRGFARPRPPAPVSPLRLSPPYNNQVNELGQ